MNETSARDAHLAAVARARVSRRDQRIAARLAELIERGIDPSSDGRTVADVLVNGGVVSRATYYRHKAEWTWSFLLGELLPIHRPKAATRLALLRDPDPTTHTRVASSALARLAPLIASGSPAGDEQDLLAAFDGLLAAAELDVEGFLRETNAVSEDPWFLLVVTASLLVDRLGPCRMEGKEDWRGVSDVVTRLYEFSALPSVRTLGMHAPSFHELDKSWIYSLVRGGTPPSQAVAIVKAAWAASTPEGMLLRKYDSTLWVAAGQALIDSHEAARRFIRSPEERKQRDDQVMYQVLSCAWRAAPVMAVSTARNRMDELSHISEVLLSAIRWDWTQGTSHLRTLGDVVTRATRNGEDLTYTNHIDETTRLAWAAWTLTQESASPSAVMRASEVLLEFALERSQTVGRQPGGTLLDLKGIRPAIVTCLHTSAFNCDSVPGVREAILDLVERVTSASETATWSRLHHDQQKVWHDFIRKVPKQYRLERVAPQMRGLTKALDRLESAFTSGARIEVDDLAGLMQATERVACLTSWAASGEWSAPWDTPDRSDVGTPFTRPPSQPPSQAEALGNIVRKSVNEQLAASLSRNTMAVKWAADTRTE